MLRRKRYRTASWSRSFRQKHRAVWLAAVSSLIILSLVGGIVLAVAFLTRVDTPYRIGLAADSLSDVELITSGINLQGMPEANLIQNPSFEPAVRYYHTTVHDFERVNGYHRLRALDDEGGLGRIADMDLAGSRYSLMRQDSNGLLTEVNHGTILANESSRLMFDLFEKIPAMTPTQNEDSVAISAHIPTDIDDGPLVAVNRLGSIYWEEGDNLVPYHIQSDGTVEVGANPLNDDRSMTPYLGVHRVEDYFYIVRGDGRVYRTRIDDPLGWTMLDAVTAKISTYIHSSDQLAGSGINALAGLFSIDDVLIILFNNGTYWQIRGEEARFYDIQDYVDESGNHPITLTDGFMFSSGINMGNSMVWLSESDIYAFSMEMADDGFLSMRSYQTLDQAEIDLPLAISHVGMAAVARIDVIDENLAVLSNISGIYVYLERKQAEDGEDGFSFGDSGIIPVANYEDLIVSFIPIQADLFYVFHFGGQIDLYSTADGVPRLLDSGQLEEGLIKLPTGVSDPAFITHFDLQAIQLVPQQGLVFMDSLMNRYHLPFGLQIDLESDLLEDNTATPLEYRPASGDLLILEYKAGTDTGTAGEVSSTAPTAWDIDGSFALSAYTNDADQVGQHHLTLSPEASVKQLLAEDSDPEVFDTRGLYTISFDAKQAADSTANLSIEITGPFPTIRLDFAKIKQNWKRFEETFIIPKQNRPDSTTEIRISWSGEGDVDLDNIFLGASRRGSNVYDEEIAEQIVQTSPSVIRFADAAIGQESIDANAWLSFGIINQYSTGDAVGHNPSLEAALRLAKSSGSDAWLIFDSYASVLDAKNFMAYLAGGINDAVGQRRLENGTAIPWTNQLSRIYVEVSDSYGVYRTDSERAAFVDSILSGLAESPYYNSIKNQLVLIDAMNYKEGLMQSSADYHASELTIRLDEGSTVDEALDLAYDRFAEQRPRRFNLPGSAVNELISNLSLETDGETDMNVTVHAADLLWAGLYEEERAGASILLNLDFRREDPVYNAMLLNVAGILAPFANSRRVIVDAGSLDPYVNETAEDYFHTVALNHEDRLVLFLMNQGDQAISIQLAFGIERNAARLSFYDNQGVLQHSQAYLGDNKRILIPVGGIAVLEEDAD